MYCKPRDARKGVSNRTTLNRSGRLLCGGHFFVPTFDAETIPKLYSSPPESDSAKRLRPLVSVLLDGELATEQYRPRGLAAKAQDLSGTPCASRHRVLFRVGKRHNEPTGGWRTLVPARLEELSRQGRRGEQVASRPALKKDGLTCRFRRASFDVLVGEEGMSLPAGTKLGPYEIDVSPGGLPELKST